ncbi:hypothetical protein V3W47_14345 [Deinococcus sp. YIM 134068]|uniref:hypothetical protein n=1 Tax=Deinococcus lichenicola TaxID=3118910 RepID=UPI002F931551
MDWKPLSRPPSGCSPPPAAAHRTSRLDRGPGATVVPSRAPPPEGTRGALLAVPVLALLLGWRLADGMSEGGVRRQILGMRGFRVICKEIGRASWNAGTSD